MNIPSRVAASGSVFLLSLFLAGPSPAGGQDVEWAVEGEVGGSLFFGNRSQTVLSTRGLAERVDPVFESTSEVSFTYGRASDDEGQSFVNRRSWDAATDLAFRPDQRWSPFVSGKIESSLERQIDLRFNTGAGMKLVIRRDDLTRIDLSASALAERTFPRHEDGVVEDETRARWSTRLRFRRDLADERVEFSSETSYRPVFDDPSDFTLTHRTTLSFDVTDAVRLRLTFVDDYDAGAVDRGARTNNDGQVQVSVVAELD